MIQVINAIIRSIHIFANSGIVKYIFQLRDTKIYSATQDYWNIFPNSGLLPDAARGCHLFLWSRVFPGKKYFSLLSKKCFSLSRKKYFIFFFFEKEILFSFGVRKIYTASLEAWKMQCKLSSLSLLQLTCCACNLLCRSFTVHYFCHQHCRRHCHQHRRRHCCHFHCCHVNIILNNQVLPSWKSSSRGSIGAKIRTTEKNGLLMFNAGPGVIMSFISFFAIKNFCRFLQKYLSGKKVNMSLNYLRLFYI